MNCGVRRARASLAMPSGTPPYNASATEPAIAPCVSASPPRATARRTASSKDVEVSAQMRASGTERWHVSSNEQEGWMST